MNSPLAPPGSLAARQVLPILVLDAPLRWVCAGLAVLLFTAIDVIADGTVWPTHLNERFGGMVVLFLIGRWICHRSGSSTTLAVKSVTDALLRYRPALDPDAQR